MSKTITLLASAAILTTLATTAQASDIRGGMYVSGSVGYNRTNDQDYDRPTHEAKFDLENNASFTGAVGYKFPERERGRWRVEGELGYRANDVKGAKTNGTAQSPVSGDQEVMSGMANVYYDFSRMHRKFVPYVGAGIGIARVSVNDVRYGASTADGDSTNFAWQAMVGADYKLTEKTSLYGDVRYFTVLEPEVNNGAGNPDIEGEYDAFTVSAGVKYDF